MQDVIIKTGTISRMILSGVITALLLMSAVVRGSAQYDPGYTHYMFNEIFINPAYAGAKDALSVTGLARDQWTGFPGAPRTVSLTAHLPLADDRIGLGVGANYETIGVHNHASGSIDFAYRIHLRSGIWAIGLQGSVGYQDNRYYSLQNLPDDPGIDPLLQGSGEKVAANAGFGTYYYTKHFYIGFSIPCLLNSNYVEGLNRKFDLRNWTYYLQSGYVFQCNDKLEIMPAVMLKATPGVRPQLNLSALSLWWNTLWLGGDYRTDNSIAGLAGVQFAKQFRLCYSYDMSLDHYIRNNFGGSHELSLTYTFDVVHKRVVSPRLF